MECGDRSISKRSLFGIGMVALTFVNVALLNVRFFGSDQKVFSVFTQCPTSVPFKNGMPQQQRPSHTRTGITAITTQEDHTWCDNILRQYNDKSVEWPEMQIENAKFASQFNQDWFVFSSMLRSMYNAGDIGTYVDLAAHDYKRISNTFFLDKCLSWNGICIEAEPEYTRTLAERRGCHLVDTCIWSEPKTMTFVRSGGSGAAGLKGFNKLEHFHESGTETEMQCTTLKKVFSDTNVTHIDYMSLDIEGSENHALLGIDFSRVQIDVITVEGNDENVVKTLEENGFVLKFCLHEDYVFVHRNAKQKMADIDAWIANAPWQTLLNETGRFHPLP